LQFSVGEDQLSTDGTNIVSTVQRLECGFERTGHHPCVIVEQQQSGASHLGRTLIDRTQKVKILAIANYPSAVQPIEKLPSVVGGGIVNDDYLGWHIHRFDQPA
jgi:hypothetical protein